MLSHHTLFCACLESGTPGIVKNTREVAESHQQCNIFHPVVSSEGPNNKHFTASVSCERVSTSVQSFHRITHAFQDLLKEGVCAPSNDEFQNYQALHPNRPCPNDLSAWEPWVPLQP